MNSAADFERLLRAQIEDNFIKKMPAGFLAMRVSDFCGLASTGIGTISRATQQQQYNDLETPKTATRRSNRQNILNGSAVSTAKSTTSRKLFPHSTPSKYQVIPSSSSSTPHLPQTPHHLTIKSTASVMKSQNRRNHHPISTPSKQSARKILPPSSSSSSSNQTPQTDNNSGGIVQFQLTDGNVIDVDFSRSPKSALEQANLLGSEAIGEVKAKIETYANQFMQYLKFFKKFKPPK